MHILYQTPNHQPTPLHPTHPCQIYGTDIQRVHAKDYIKFVTQQRVGPVHIHLKGVSCVCTCSCVHAHVSVFVCGQLYVSCVRVHFKGLPALSAYPLTLNHTHPLPGYFRRRAAPT